MQLSDNQYKFFNKLISSSNELIEDKPGALIFSSIELQNKLIFVRSGEVRLIDEESTFGSKTISKIDAPLLFGGSNLLNIKVDEIIRSSKKVKFHLVDFEELKQDDLAKVKLLFKTYCSDFELVEIYKILSKCNCIFI